MPVPVNNKLKNATRVNNKNVSFKAPNGAKKVAGANAKTTPSSQTKKKATRTMANVNQKSIKSEPRMPAETINSKNVGKTTGETVKKLKSQNSTSNLTKNLDLHTQKSLKMKKVHPEVDKLVQMLKASIKEEINESKNRLKNIKEAENQSYNDLKNIKTEMCNETEESSSCESWGLESESIDSSDNEYSDTDSCNDSECSCCTDTYDSSQTDNTSSCSDDENDETSASSCDEDFIDEYTINEHDDDSVDHNCSGCGKCLPGTAALTNSSNHTPKREIKSTFMQRANQLQKKNIERTTKPAKNIAQNKTQADVKPNVKAATSTKKVSSNKAGETKTKRGPTKKNVATAKTGPTKKNATTAKTAKTGPTKKNVATAKTGPTKKNAATTKTGPTKKSTAVTKAGQTKKNTAATKADQKNKAASLARAAPSRQCTALTEITNFNSANAPHSNPKVIIKKPCHALKLASSHSTISTNSVKASTSSGCCTWTSALLASQSSILKPTKQCSYLPIEDQRSKPALTAPKSRRSIGVSCHLPDANSTFQNNWHETLWRY